MNETIEYVATLCIGAALLALSPWIGGGLPQYTGLALIALAVIAPNVAAWADRSSDMVPPAPPSDE